MTFPDKWKQKIKTLSPFKTRLKWAHGRIYTVRNKIYHHKYVELIPLTLKSIHVPNQSIRFTSDDLFVKLRLVAIATLRTPVIGKSLGTDLTLAYNRRVRGRFLCL